MIAKAFDRQINDCIHSSFYDNEHMHIQIKIKIRIRIRIHYTHQWKLMSVRQLANKLNVHYRNIHLRMSIHTTGSWGGKGGTLEPLEGGGNWSKIDCIYIASNPWNPGFPSIVCTSGPNPHTTKYSMIRPIPIILSVGLPLSVSLGDLCGL